MRAPLAAARPRGRPQRAGGGARARRRRPSPLPLRKRQLRGAGAAFRHLPRPPRRRPAPQPGRRVPRLLAKASRRLCPASQPAMNIMDFNVKKLAADAGTFLSRAVQVRRRRPWQLRPGGGGVAPGRASGGRVADGVARVPRPPDGRGLAPRSPHRRPAPGVLRPGTAWFHPGAEASLPRPARRGRARRPSTFAPPPPFPALALALRAESNGEGSFPFPAPRRRGAASPRCPWKEDGPRA